MAATLLRHSLHTPTPTTAQQRCGLKRERDSDDSSDSPAYDKDAERRTRRRLSNCQASKKARAKKNQRLADMEVQLSAMASSVDALTSLVTTLRNENAALREHMGQAANAIPLSPLPPSPAFSPAPSLLQYQQQQQHSLLLQQQQQQLQLHALFQQQQQQQQQQLFAPVQPAVLQPAVLTRSLSSGAPSAASSPDTFPSCTLGVPAASGVDEGARRSASENTWPAVPVSLPLEVSLAERRVPYFHLLLLVCLCARLGQALLMRLCLTALQAPYLHQAAFSSHCGSSSESKNNSHRILTQLGVSPRFLLSLVASLSSMHSTPSPLKSFDRKVLSLGLKLVAAQLASPGPAPDMENKLVER